MKVLRRCLTTTSDCADATWSGNSFHMLAPATGNARLPTVERPSVSLSICLRVGHVWDPSTGPVESGRVGQRNHWCPVPVETVCENCRIH